MTTRKELAGQADRLLEAAFNAAIEVLEDKKAPSTAKSSSTASAIRIYELLRPGAAGDKQPAEMSLEELQEKITSLRQEQVEDDPETAEASPKDVSKSADLW